MSFKPSNNCTQACVFPTRSDKEKIAVIADFVCCCLRTGKAIRGCGRSSSPLDTPQLGFLGLSMIDIWELENIPLLVWVCRWVCPVRWRTCSSISGSYLIRARTLTSPQIPVPPRADQKCLQALPNVLWGAKLSPCENHCLSVASQRGICAGEIEVPGPWCLCPGSATSWLPSSRLPSTYPQAHVSSLSFSFFDKWGHCLLHRINGKNQ